MSLAEHIKPITYLKSSAAEIVKEFSVNPEPLIITQNGEASMVIESVKQFQEKEVLIAALKVMAMGEKARMQGQGISATDARSRLQAVRQSRK